VGPALEVLAADEAHVGLVHQGRGIEGVIGPFVGHPDGQKIDKDLPSMIFRPRGCYFPDPSGAGRRELRSEEHPR
jgi:hypothetical protein